MEAAPEALALSELATGQRWAFADLQREVVAHDPIDRGGIVVQGNSASFIIRTLVAWRDGQVLWPCEAGEATPDELPSCPAEVCHVKRTSGSTGAPRSVYFTAAQLAADADQIVSTMGLKAKWPNLGVISLAHSYGFSNLVLPLLLHGIPLVLVPDALPGTLERALALFPTVTLPAVPAMWKAWHGSGVLDGDRVRLAISAGAPLTRPLEQVVFEDTGIKIHNFYGSTECGGIAYDRTEDPRPLDGYVGTAMDGVQLSLAEGRLRVESHAVALSYAGSESGEILGEGTFLTADEAEIDDRGRVFLRGRRGEAINVAGRKISPDAVEEVLQGLDGVEQALVFGVPSEDAERVEDLVAAVRLSEGASLTDVKRRATGGLPGWKRPRKWWCCADLAPDGRGKTSRARWRARYLKGRE